MSFSFASVAHYLAVLDRPHLSQATNQPRLLLLRSIPQKKESCLQDAHEGIGFVPKTQEAQSQDLLATNRFAHHSEYFE